MDMVTWVPKRVCENYFPFHNIHVTITIKMSIGIGLGTKCANRNEYKGCGKSFRLEQNS
jgi:hypothetical protein